jgi:hypothetical protein
MEHASEADLKTIEGLLGGGGSKGSVTLRRDLAAVLVDEIRKHRGRDQRAKASAEHGTVEVGTLISSRTKEGMVELVVNGQTMQMTLPKAREVRGMLDGAIEAAVSDQLLYQFLMQRIGLSDDAAGRALLDFREMRQGSRKTVFPT